MNVGRNDECHCGSGKKYKKCCLASDQAAEQSKPAQLLPRSIGVGLNADEDTRVSKSPVSGTTRSPEIPVSAPKASDPKMDAINARWEEFTASTEDVRRELYIKTLDDPELMDDEMAFEMLSQLYDSTIKSDDREIWDSMLEQLQQRLPDVYAASRKYYLGWRITNMIATGRRERVKPLALEMAELAGNDVDQYAHVVDLLAYHGMLNELSEMSHAAWPHIKGSGNIMWGQNTFAEWGSDCVLFEQLEQTGELRHEDSELMQKLEYYFEDLQTERFSEYVKSIGGQSDRNFSLSEFKTMSQKRRNDRYDDESEQVVLTPDARSALSSLLNIFIDYAHRVEGVPYTKAKLASENFFSYIYDRLVGKLEPRQSMLESMTNPQRKPKPKPKPPTHVLCPDHATLDRYLAGKLHFMNPQRYQVAATFELIPAWLRFLETKGLLESAMRESTLKDLGKLHATLCKLFDSDRSDPALSANMNRWMKTTDSMVAERE